MIFINRANLLVGMHGGSLNVAKCRVIAVIHVVTVGSIDTLGDAGELKCVAKLFIAITHYSSMVAHIRIITLSGKHQRLTLFDVACEVIT